jgi:hypothetical protein
MARRRKLNPGGAEVLPWLLGIAAVGGVGFLIYNQMQTSNAAAIAAANAGGAGGGGGTAPPPTDNTVKDWIAAIATGGQIYKDVSGNFFDTSGNQTDQYGNPIDSTAAANAAYGASGGQG